MNCRRARKLLTGTSGTADPAAARHLAGCPDCERFAARWAEVRRTLATRQTRATPDAGFAARVISRLDPPADPLTWAARRLLPATLALTLVLGGWCLLRTPAPASLAGALGEGDLLSWVAGEEAR